MKPDSQNARLLTVLRAGPATNAQIHRLAGDMIVNSRVAELRKLGYRIECEHIGGTGPDAFVYTLLTTGGKSPQPGLSAPRSRAADDGSASRFGLAPPASSPGFPPVSPATDPVAAAVAGEQLSLEVAA